jgi:chromosome segregation ATPase
MDTDQAPSDRQPNEDQNSGHARLDALLEAKDEIIAELRSRVESLEHQLNVRRKEIRRRDAALEREQQLTAMFAERLRALEAPGSGATERREEAVHLRRVLEAGRQRESARGSGAAG